MAGPSNRNQPSCPQSVGMRRTRPQGKPLNPSTSNGPAWLPLRRFANREQQCVRQGFAFLLGLVGLVRVRLIGSEPLKHPASDLYVILEVVVEGAALPFPFNLSIQGAEAVDVHVHWKHEHWMELSGGRRN